MTPLFSHKSASIVGLAFVTACGGGAPAPASAPPPAPVASVTAPLPVASSTPVATTPPPAVVAPVPFEPKKVDHHDTAMGTTVTFVAFTNARVDETAHIGPNVTIEAGAHQ